MQKREDVSDVDTHLATRTQAGSAPGCPVAPAGEPSPPAGAYIGKNPFDGALVDGWHKNQLYDISVGIIAVKAAGAIAVVFWRSFDVHRL